MMLIKTQWSRKIAATVHPPMSPAAMKDLFKQVDKNIYKRNNKPREMFKLRVTGMGCVTIAPYEHPRMGIPLYLNATKQKFYARAADVAWLIFGGSGPIGDSIPVWMAGQRPMRLGDMSGRIWSEERPPVLQNVNRIKIW